MFKLRRALPANCRHLIVALTALSAAALAGACRSTTAPAVSADTWAVVNGKSITRQEVDKAYRRAQNPAQPLSDEETLAAKLSVLDDLVTQQLLLAKATSLKLDVTPAEIDTAYADAKKNIPDDAFQQELTRRGMTPTELRDALRGELLARKVVAQDVGAKVAVTDQEINDFFNANRAQFNVPEEAYHLAQLVVTPVREAQQTNRRGDDATTQQAADAKTQALVERLKAGGSFAELAADYSEDPESSQRGGDLGLVPVSRLMQAPPALRTWRPDSATCRRRRCASRLPRRSARAKNSFCERRTSRRFETTRRSPTTSRAGWLNRTASCRICLWRGQGRSKPGSK
jgi:parvulin-like peptidyl-prolyl isomerase